MYMFIRLMLFSHILLVACVNNTLLIILSFFCLFNETATTEIYTHSCPTRRSSDLLGAVKGWCSASQRFSSSLNSNIGKSTTHNGAQARSEEHTSELQSLMRISYAVFCLKKKKQNKHTTKTNHTTSTKKTNHR